MAVSTMGSEIPLIPIRALPHPLVYSPERRTTLEPVPVVVPRQPNRAARDRVDAEGVSVSVSAARQRFEGIATQSAAPGDSLTAGQRHSLNNARTGPASRNWKRVSAPNTATRRTSQPQDGDFLSTALAPPASLGNDTIYDNIPPTALAAEPVDSVPFDHILDMFEQLATSPPSSPQFNYKSRRASHRIALEVTDTTTGDTKRLLELQTGGAAKAPEVDIYENSLSVNGVGDRKLMYENAQATAKNVRPVVQPRRPEKPEEIYANALARERKNSVRRLFAKNPTPVQKIESEVYENVEQLKAAQGRPLVGAQHTDSSIYENMLTTPVRGFVVGPGISPNSGRQWSPSMSASASYTGMDGNSRSSTSLSNHSIRSEPLPHKATLVPRVGGNATVRGQGKARAAADSYYCVPILKSVGTDNGGQRFKQTGCTYLHFMGHVLVRQVRIGEDGSAQARLMDTTTQRDSKSRQTTVQGDPLTKFRKQQISREEFEGTWAKHRHTAQAQPGTHEAINMSNQKDKKKGEKKGLFSFFRASKKSKVAQAPQRGGTKQQLPSEPYTAMRMQRVGA